MSFEQGYIEEKALEYNYILKERGIVNYPDDIVVDIYKNAYNEGYADAMKVERIPSDEMIIKIMDSFLNHSGQMLISDYEPYLTYQKETENMDNAEERNKLFDQTIVQLIKYDLYNNSQQEILSNVPDDVILKICILSNKFTEQAAFHDKSNPIVAEYIDKRSEILHNIEPIGTKIIELHGVYMTKYIKENLFNEEKIEEN